MTRRKITLTLTEAEYGALCSAVALAEVDWSDMLDNTPSGGHFGRELNNLDRAWAKVSGAWHARARRVA